MGILSDEMLRQILFFTTNRMYCFQNCRVGVQKIVDY